MTASVIMIGAVLVYVRLGESSFFILVLVNIFMMGGKIVWQASPTAPLMNFEVLGYVVVGVILINIFLTNRVYKYVTSKNQAALGHLIFA